MNNRYILVAILALAPVAVKGMDASTQTGPEWKGPDYSFASDRTTAVTRITPTPFNEQEIHSRLNHLNKNARYFQNSEPSFLSRFGNQFATGVAFTLSGLIISLLVKEYLTPKSERDRENAQTTATEQNILNSLESDIQRLMIAIPQREQELRTATKPSDIELLNTVIRNAKELLQKKLAMHAALTQQFNENQKNRYKEQLRRVGMPQQATPAQ